MSLSLKGHVLSVRELRNSIVLRCLIVAWLLAFMAAGSRPVLANYLEDQLFYLSSVRIRLLFVVLQFLHRLIPEGKQFFSSIVLQWADSACCFSFMSRFRRRQMNRPHTEPPMKTCGQYSVSVSSPFLMSICLPNALQAMIQNWRIVLGLEAVIHQFVMNRSFVTENRSFR